MPDLGTGGHQGIHISGFPKSPRSNHSPHKGKKSTGGRSETLSLQGNQGKITQLSFDSSYLLGKGTVGLYLKETALEIKVAERIPLDREINLSGRVPIDHRVLK